MPDVAPTPAPTGVPMMDTEGRVGLYTPQAAEYLRGMGYVDGGPEAQQLLLQKNAFAAKYGTTGQAFLTGLERAGSAATFGGTTGLEELAGVDPEAIRQRELQNPTAAWLGTGIGIAAPLLIPGVGEANAVRGLSELAALSAPARIARLGGRAAKAVEAALPEVLGTTGARVASKVVGSSIEGAALGTGQTVHEAMIDPKLSAESAIANVGFGALLGAGFGGGGELLGGILKTAAPKVAPWLRDLEETQYGRTLGLDDPAVTRQLLEHRLVGPLHSPELVLAKSKALLNRAEEAGQTAVDASPDVLTPAREAAAKMATAAQHGIDAATARLEQTGKAADHGPKSILLELLGGLHGGLGEAASAFALKRGLKLLLPAGLDAKDAGRQLLASAAGRSARALEEYFPLVEPGAMRGGDESVSGIGAKHLRAQSLDAPSLPRNPPESLTPEHQAVVDNFGKDLITIDDYDHPDVKMHLDDLAKIRPEYAADVARTFRKHGITIHLGDRPAAELGGREAELRGKISDYSGVDQDANPVLYAKSAARRSIHLGSLPPGAAWSDVPYLSRPALHEVGHGLADALGLEETPVTAAAHQDYAQWKGKSYRDQVAAYPRESSDEFIAEALGRLLENDEKPRMFASRSYLQYLKANLGRR